MVFGFINDIFSKRKSSSDESSTQESTQNISGSEKRDATRTQTQMGTREQTSVQQQQQAEQATTRTLDEGTQKFLKDFMSSIGMNLASGTGEMPLELSELLNKGRDLFSRAEGAEAALGARNADIVSAARMKGQQSQDQTTNALRTLAGSGMNSGVEDLRNRGQVELETSLAGLSAELGMKGREMATAEFQAAIEPFIAGAELSASQRGLDLNRELGFISAIPEIANILKGSETFGDRLMTGTAEESVREQELVDMLEKILETREFEQTGTARGTVVGSSRGTQTGSTLDTLLGFKSLLGK